ncbi:unnamed protein product [Ectocarpus sp. 4 AP-2014]
MKQQSYGGVADCTGLLWFGMICWGTRHSTPNLLGLSGLQHDGDAGRESPSPRSLSSTRPHEVLESTDLSLVKVLFKVLGPTLIPALPTTIVAGRLQTLLTVECTPSHVAGLPRDAAVCVFLEEGLR